MAESYHASADFLKSASDWHFRFSDHPLRLLYFQALENYLRSFLRLGGKEPEEIRRYSHSFVAMLDDSAALGLAVGKDAEDFIRSSTKRGDYIQIRYHFVLREGEDRRKQPSIKILENAVSQLEKAVRLAIEATGIEIKLREKSEGRRGMGNSGKPREGSKRRIMYDLLHRPEGATLAELKPRHRMGRV